MDGQILKSKRFWLAIGSVIFVILNEKLGLDVSQETINSALMVIMTLIAGDTFKGLGSKAEPIGKVTFESKVPEKL